MQKRQTSSQKDNFEVQKQDQAKFYSINHQTVKNQINYNNHINSYPNLKTQPSQSHQKDQNSANQQSFISKLIQIKNKKQQQRKSILQNILNQLSSDNISPNQQQQQQNIQDTTNLIIQQLKQSQEKPYVNMILQKQKYNPQNQSNKQSVLSNQLSNQDKQKIDQINQKISEENQISKINKVIDQKIEWEEYKKTDDENQYIPDISQKRITEYIKKKQKGQERSIKGNNNKNNENELEQYQKFYKTQKMPKKNINNQEYTLIVKSPPKPSTDRTSIQVHANSSNNKNDNFFKSNDIYGIEQQIINNKQNNITSQQQKQNKQKDHIRKTQPNIKILKQTDLIIKKKYQSDKKGIIVETVELIKKDFIQKKKYQEQQQEQINNIEKLQVELDKQNQQKQQKKQQKDKVQLFTFKKQKIQDNQQQKYISPKEQVVQDDLSKNTKSNKDSKLNKGSRKTITRFRGPQNSATLVRKHVNFDKTQPLGTVYHYEVVNDKKTDRKILRSVRKSSRIYSKSKLKQVKQKQQNQWQVQLSTRNNNQSKNKHNNSKSKGKNKKGSISKSQSKRKSLYFANPIIKSKKKQNPPHDVYQQLNIDWLKQHFKQIQIDKSMNVFMYQDYKALTQNDQEISKMIKSIQTDIDRKNVQRLASKSKSKRRSERIKEKVNINVNKNQQKKKQEQKQEGIMQVQTKVQINYNSMQVHINTSDKTNLKNYLQEHNKISENFYKNINQNQFQNQQKKGQTNNQQFNKIKHTFRIPEQFPLTIDSIIDPDINNRGIYALVKLGRLTQFQIKTKYAITPITELRFARKIHIKQCISKSQELVPQQYRNNIAYISLNSQLRDLIQKKKQEKNKENQQKNRKQDQKKQKKQNKQVQEVQI